LVPTRTSEAGVSIKEAEADFTVVATELAKVYPKDTETFHGAHRVADKLGGRQFKTTLFIVLAAAVVTAHRMWKCGESSPGAGHYAGKGACHPFGGSAQIVETDPSTAGGKPDLAEAGPPWEPSWLGRSQVPVALMPQNIIPAEAVIRLNMPVLLFTLGVAGLTALVLA